MTNQLDRKGGPTSQEGKEVVRWNATRHGLTSPAPVIPGLENAEDWETHREGVIRDLSPQGHLEGVLAEQVASLLWRRNRVVRYELEAIVPLQEAAEQRIYQLKRYEATRCRWRFLEGVSALPDAAPVSAEEALGVIFYVADLISENQSHGIDLDRFPLPDARSDASWEPPRWTAGEFRQTLNAVAESTGDDPTRLLTLAEGLAHLEFRQAERDIESARLESSSGTDERDRIWREQRVLPSDEVVEKIVRYETFFTRQLDKTFAQLKSLQSARRAQASGCDR